MLTDRMLQLIRYMVTTQTDRHTDMTVNHIIAVRFAFPLRASPMRYKVKP